MVNYFPGGRREVPTQRCRWREIFAITTHDSLKCLRRFAPHGILTPLGFLLLALQAFAQAPGLSGVERTQLLKERDVTFQAALMSRAAGRYDTSLKQLDEVAEQERRLGLEGSDEFAGTLEMMARVHERP